MKKQRDAELLHKRKHFNPEFITVFLFNFSPQRSYGNLASALSEVGRDRYPFLIITTAFQFY